MKTAESILKRLETLEASLSPEPMLFEYEDADGQERLIGIDEYEAIARANNYSFFLTISDAGGNNLRDLERHLKIITEHAGRCEHYKPNDK